MTKVIMNSCYFSGIRQAFKLMEDRYADWVLLAAQSGRFAFSMDNHDNPIFQEAGFGELVICPPGVTLKRKVLEPLSFFFIEFTTEYPCPHGLILFRDMQRLASTFNYLRSLSIEPLDEHRAFASHLIQDLLLVIARGHETTRRKDLKDHQDPIVARILAYLDSRAFDGDINLQRFAKEIGLSGSQLTRQFQQACLQSPIDYVTALRLQKARSLLTDTDETLDSIAEQCGYQNAYYFSRMFKKKLKINPSEYRKKSRF